MKTYKASWVSPISGDIKSVSLEFSSRDDSLRYAMKQVDLEKIYGLNKPNETTMLKQLEDFGIIESVESV